MSRFNNIREITDECVWVGMFIMTHDKGQSFEFNDKTYTVTTKTKKSFRLKDNNGVNYSYQRFGNSSYGNTQQVRRLEDDIKSTISLDLINELNPLHETSHITTRLETLLKEYKTK